MICPKCESEIKDTAKFCDFCGHHLTDSERTSSSYIQEEKEEPRAYHQEEVSQSSALVQGNVDLAPFYLRAAHFAIDLITVSIIIQILNPYFNWIIGMEALLSEETLSFTDAISKVNASDTKIQVSPFVIAPIFAYWFIQENFLGKTLGKFITRTKIISHKGDKPSKTTTLFRCIIIAGSITFQLVPFIAISFLASYLLHKKALGFHDLVSKTLVVKND